MTPAGGGAERFGDVRVVLVSIGTEEQSVMSQVEARPGAAVLSKALLPNPTGTSCANTVLI